ncbi:MAG TPA: hypothetical protein VF134_08615 [Candidatus Dormibacteraeota bacterium]
MASMRRGIAGYAGGLVLQFWLGMWVNLFVTIPRQHPGAQPPEYFSGVAVSVSWAILQPPSLWLAAHALLGLILVLGAAGLIARAVQLRSRPLIISLGIGALAVLAAGFNGGSYLNYHEDFSSMLMATGFAIAMLAYLYALGTMRDAAAAPAP